MRRPPDLPADLKATLDRLAHGRSRNAPTVRAAVLSRHYRAGGGSQTIATGDDARWRRTAAAAAAPALAHGLIVIGVPFGTTRHTSSISRFVTAMHPAVQSNVRCNRPSHPSPFLMP
jgi:hypothetical protein